MNESQEIATIEAIGLLFMQKLINKSLKILGLASGPGPGDPVQGRTPGEHRWREVGKVSRLPSSGTLCQPLPHQCLSQGAGPLPSKLRQYSQ